MPLSEKRKLQWIKSIYIILPGMGFRQLHGT